MNAPRNFRLNCTNSVLMPPMLGRPAAIVAGEACTELGCDVSSAPRLSWWKRWLRTPLKGLPVQERKKHATHE